MTSLHEISERVMSLLAGEMSQEDFEEWSARSSWDTHLQDSEAVRDLSYKIRGILNAHSDDEDDDLMRQELASAIFPFLELETRAGEPSSSPSLQANVEQNLATAPA